jgi:hypothetical protein
VETVTRKLPGGPECTLNLPVILALDYRSKKIYVSIGYTVTDVIYSTRP